MGVGAVCVTAALIHPPMSMAYPKRDAASLLEYNIDGEGWLDLNAADRAMLESLPGIGPVIAGRILDYRAMVGGFTDERELIRVSGIGEKTILKLLPLVYAGDLPDAPDYLDMLNGP
ncbi:hypothetical protein AGMMS49992_01350 [Clostridia bacterium]|nr:hypothetical protein AGMMS49992_01350 [Clostridia bacterium]